VNLVITYNIDENGDDNITDPAPHIEQAWYTKGKHHQLNNVTTGLLSEFPFMVDYVLGEFLAHCHGICCLFFMIIW
jgi:hypothetical protein